MSPRRWSALLCLVGAALIVWGVTSKGFWWKRLETERMVGDIKLGLVSVTACTHDALGAWRCESVDWKRIGVTADSALWVWSGRLLFGVALAAAIALALAAIIAAVPIRGTLPVSPPRLGLAFAGAALVLVAIYRLSTPDGVLLLLDAGRAWWLTLAGLAVGAVGGYRELDPAED